MYSSVLFFLTLQVSAQQWNYSVPFIDLTQQAKESPSMATIAKPLYIGVNPDPQPEFPISDPAHGPFIKMQAQLEPYHNNATNTTYWTMGECMKYLAFNSCAMQIHGGNGCSAVRQGPTYHANGAVDPWVDISIESESVSGYADDIFLGRGISTFKNVTGVVDAGSVQGKVAMIFNPAGEPVWCGKIYQECSSTSECFYADHKCLPFANTSVQQKYCCPQEQQKDGKCLDDAFDGYAVKDNEEKSVTLEILV